MSTETFNSENPSSRRQIETNHPSHSDIRTPAEPDGRYDEVSTNTFHGRPVSPNADIRDTSSNNRNAVQLSQSRSEVENASLISQRPISQTQESTHSEGNKQTSSAQDDLSNAAFKKGDQSSNHQKPAASHTVAKEFDLASYLRHRIESGDSKNDTSNSVAGKKTASAPTENYPPISNKSSALQTIGITTRKISAPHSKPIQTQFQQSVRPTIQEKTTVERGHADTRPGSAITHFVTDQEVQQELVSQKKGQATEKKSGPRRFLDDFRQKFTKKPTNIRHYDSTALSKKLIESRQQTTQGYRVPFHKPEDLQTFKNDLQKLQKTFPILKAVRVDDGAQSAHFPFSRFELQSLFKDLAETLSETDPLNDLLDKIDGIFSTIDTETVLHIDYAADVYPYGGYDQDVENLTLAAQQGVQTFNSATKHGPSNKVIPKSLSRHANTPHKAFEALLKKNKGVSIGEVHSDKASKKIIIDNMIALKKLGVTRIYLEHLITNFHSQELKLYFQSPKNTPMPDGLASHLQQLDRGYGLTESDYSFFQLVKASKDHGIEVKAFDTMASYNSYKPSIYHDQKNSQQRYLLMNHLARETVQQDESANEKGKWVMLVGSGHLTTLEGIPGVADLTDTPAIIVKDGDQNQVQQGKLNHHGIEPDVMITLQDNLNHIQNV